MRIFWFWPIAFVVVLAHAQTSDKPGSAPQRHLTVADFGLAYPLSRDWVRATQMLRKRLETGGPEQNFDVLLAAVYVPKEDISAASPFFTLRAYRQPASDCKKSL